MTDLGTRVLRGLASMKLAMGFMALAMVLVLAGTLAQIDQDIHTVQETYFRAWIVYVPFWHVFLPGGYTIGFGMLGCLIGATFRRPLRLAPRQLGVFFTHMAVVMFLAGELATALFAVETNMEIREGQTVNYSFSTREVELAVVDRSPADHDRVVAVPQGQLRSGAEVQHPLMPFKLEVRRYLPRSQVVQATQAQPTLATVGLGTRWAAIEAPAGEEGRALPSAYVAVTSATGAELGVYLLSVLASDPQPVVIDGKPYDLALRFRRYYKDFSLRLHDFAHDRYTGTNVPKNFSSRVQLVDPANSVDREVLIWMNNPLRYGGEAFYQSAYKDNETTTVLQVVRNPGWTVPYLAMGLGGLGMCLYFGQALVQAVRSSGPRKSRLAGRSGRS